MLLPAEHLLEIERISHRDAPAIRSAATAMPNTACRRARSYHVEDRVIPDARKTMVFVDRFYVKTLDPDGLKLLNWLLISRRNFTSVEFYA